MSALLTIAWCAAAGAAAGWLTSRALTFVFRLTHTHKPTVVEVEVAAGVWNGQPVVSMLMVGDGFQDGVTRADEAWWNGLSDAERAEHTAWENAETERWLAWARQNA